MMIVGDKAGIFVWSWRCWKVEGNFMGGLGWFCMVTFSVVFGMGWWLKQVAEMAEMRRDRECSTSHASGLMLRCGEGLVGDFVVFWGKITQGSWIWNRLTIVFLFLSRFLMIPSLFFTVLKVIWKTQCGRCSLISSWDFEILKHSRMEVESWLSTKMWSEAKQQIPCWKRNLWWAIRRLHFWKRSFLGTRLYQDGQDGWKVSQVFSGSVIPWNSYFKFSSS